MKETKNKTPKDGDDESIKMATAGELFSFAQTFRTKLYIAIAFGCAAVAGSVMPGRSYAMSRKF